MVSLNTAQIMEEKPLFEKVIKLCEKGEYYSAMPILVSLIAKNPSVSEYHRILGQLYSIDGKNEEAINSLIDALRWDPQNHSALTMMGNIYFRNYKDENTAKKYFDEALAQNPDDVTALVNYATLFLMSQKYAEAKQYFEQAYSIDIHNPNAAYGIAYCLNQQNEVTAGFEYAIHGLKHCKKLDKEIYTALFNLAKALGEKAIESNIGNYLIADFKSTLESASGIAIQIEVDDSISTFAKIEFAESHQRNYHLLKHKSKKGLEHLIMHELTHLLFAVQAREITQQMLFISTQENKGDFYRDLNKHKNLLMKQGISDESVIKYFNSIFNGINLQIYNTPIDLFIEDYLYNNYPSLKPIQFISWLNILENGKDSVTNKEAIKLSPVHIYQASKILNLVQVHHFENLFGVDLMNDFLPNKFEQNMANKFYEEYLEYREDKEAGEEYELIQHWGEDLKINKYFQLVPEEEYLKRLNPNSLLQSIEDEPYGAFDPVKEKQVDEFIKSQTSETLNLVIVMHMIEALKYLKKMPIPDIQKIAMEIALLGAHGISTEADKKYKVANIPNQSLTGNQLLAYFYVSFKLALPAILPELRLPYDKEFEMADGWIER
ncbi:MAG: tetratricopeptide repeat protein [Bacteroidota bacterium]|nr:tetratricopeptide repeat protein [Bacteroidota bacterium]